MVSSPLFRAGNDDTFGWKPNQGGNGFTEFDDMDYRVGAEWMYQLSEDSAFALRSGYSYDKDGKTQISHLWAGLEIQLGKFRYLVFCADRRHACQQYIPLLGWIYILILAGSAN